MAVEKRSPVSPASPASPIDIVDENIIRKYQFGDGDDLYAKLQRFAGSHGIEQRGIERVPSDERSMSGMLPVALMVKRPHPRFTSTPTADPSPHKVALSQPRRPNLCPRCNRHPRLRPPLLRRRAHHRPGQPHLRPARLLLLHSRSQARPAPARPLPLLLWLVRRQIWSVALPFASPP
jgi:hypothetical protein